MKKSWILLAFAVLLLTACTPFSRPEVKPTSPSEDSILTAPPSEESSVVTEETETSAPATQPLVLEDLVKDETTLHLVGTDSVGNKYDCTYVLPEILLDSPDARKCNQEILDTYTPIMEEAQKELEDGVSLVNISISYEAYLWQDVLSVVVTVDSCWDMQDYGIWVFDAASGSLLDQTGLLEKLGVSQEDFIERRKTGVSEWLESTLDGIPDKDSSDFIRSLRERTLADENLDTSVLYLGEDGQPMLCCWIFSLAGAEAYLRCFPITLN